MKNLGTIPGSTGTTFDVIAALSAGKVGIRNLGGSEFRVRVVPNGTSLNLGSGWKQPNSQQNRYSKVVSGQVALGQAVADATKALSEKSFTVSVQ